MTPRLTLAPDRRASPHAGRVATLAILGLTAACGSPIIPAEGRSQGMYSPCGRGDPSCAGLIDTPTHSGSGGGSGLALSDVQSSEGTLRYIQTTGCEAMFSVVGTRVEDGYCPDCDLTLSTTYSLLEDSCGTATRLFDGAVGIRQSDDGELSISLVYAQYDYYYGYYEEYYGYDDSESRIVYTAIGDGYGDLTGRLLNYLLYSEPVYYGYDYDDYGYYGVAPPYSTVYNTIIGDVTLSP